MSFDGPTGREELSNKRENTIKNLNTILKQKLNEVKKFTNLLTSEREDCSLTKLAISSFAAPASTFFKKQI